VNTAEHLPSFDNPARGSIADFGKWPAAWPINTGQAEDMQRQVGGLPSGFGGNAQCAAPGAGSERGGFIHPGTVMIAIDTRG